jgi:HAE1 family hydrophobic/amphiphilic exporter-1
MMCARLLKDQRHQTHGRIYQWCERGFELLLNFYERTLRIALHFRFVTLLVMIGTIVLTGYLYYMIPKGFFPLQDTGMLYGIAEAAQDISFPAMAERQQALMNVVLQDPAVESVSDFMGPGGSTPTLNQGRGFVVLKPIEERKISAAAVIERLRPKLAQVQGATLYLQPAQDITIGARIAKTQYQYTLYDADSRELDHWVDIFFNKMRSMPQITDVATDQENAGPMLNVTTNREVASTFGILPATIDNTLDDAFGQRIVSTIYTELNQYHVVLEVAPEFQFSPQALKDIYVNSSTNQQVPLSTLVHSEIKPAPIVINHQGMFPSATISFNLKPNVALGQAVDAIRKFEKDSGKPASVATSFQGNAQAFQASLASTPILIATALVVIYIILGVLYESTIHPLTILSTLPSAGLGALLILMAVHLDLSVIAIIGIILLIGIVKKNGIMLVDFALQSEREHDLDPEESIYRACTLRFRPILMTTMAAMFGGVPLMLGTGNGAELRQPLGYTIVGGLLVSQLLTLYTTPVVYLYLDKLSGALKRRRQHASAKTTPAE